MSEHRSSFGGSGAARSTTEELLHENEVLK